MLLLINALGASLDGLIIGISLKLAKTKITFSNYLLIALTNTLIYTSIILLYTKFSLKLITPLVISVFYLYLAWHTYHEKNSPNIKSLSIKQSIFLAIIHALDGSIIALNFVYDYPLFLIIFIFAFFSIFCLVLGYLLAKHIKLSKNSNKVSALLFILLAILNYFL